MASPSSTSTSAHEPTQTWPLPGEQLLGPGRDRRFRLTQYTTRVRGVQTAYFDEYSPPIGSATTLGPKLGPKLRPPLETPVLDVAEPETLVFIHGLAGNVTHWLHVAPEFTRQHVRVVGLDLPGCGATPALATGYSIAAYATHTLAWLDAIGVGRATLVGHSLGGMVAMEMARQQRGRIDGMLLVGSAGFQPVPQALRLAGRAVLNERLLGRLLPRVWQNILQFVFARDNEHTRGFIRSVRETYDPKTDVRAIAQVMAGLKRDFLHDNYEQVLRGLDCPVHLLWGSADKLVPAKQLDRLTVGRDNVKVTLVPDCGHLPIIEAPDAVIDALERLRGDVASRAAAG